MDGLIHSIKVFKNGEVYFYDEALNNAQRSFKINFGNTEIDSISMFVNKIFSIPIAPLYGNNCHDCGCFNLIITTKHKNFKSVVNGFDRSEKEVQIMADLITFISKKTKQSCDSIQQNFTFDSRTIQFQAPPLPDNAN